MITNNSTSYMLKASRSSQKTPDNEDTAEETDRNSTLVEGDGKNDFHRKLADGKLRPNKTNGLFVAKTPGRSDRRNAFHNKTLRKTPEAGFTCREAGLFPYSKYEASDRKNDAKFNLPEDTRISKLLRRLSNEEDTENSLQISKKLLEVIMLPENAAYVRKSFAILRDSMLHILHVAPGVQAKRQCARAFGRIGYIMAHESYDFGKYVKVIVKFNEQTGHEDMLCLCMEALEETLDLQRKNSVLDKNRMYCLLQELILIMDSTENVEVFKLILDNLMSAIEFYPSNFNEYFKDTIDLLLGWHVDHTQSLSNIEFISKQLQRVAGHFQRNIDMSSTFIKHFVEDIERYTVKISEDDESKDESIDQVIVFILALNTVLKCLRCTNLSVHKLFTKKFMTSGLKQILQAIRQNNAMKIYDHLIIAANETVQLLLTFYLVNKSSSDQYPKTAAALEAAIELRVDHTIKEPSFNEMVMSLIEHEIALMDYLSDSSILSSLALISKVIKEFSADLDVPLVAKLIGPESSVLKLRYHPYKDLQDATICVYQALLNVKNIPLLQEVYRYLLGDLQASYKCILMNFDCSMITNSPFDELAKKDGWTEYMANAKQNCMFLLRCLSQLANDSGSLLGMWILKPSILEVLAVHMQPFQPSLAQEAPILQYSILYLLYSHCKCYNFFISCSNLVNMPTTSEFVGTSPNSGNFSIALSVLYETFKSACSIDVKLLVLQWWLEILTIGEPYLECLYVNVEFSSLTEILLQNANDKHPLVALAAAKCLERLLGNKQLPWRNNFLEELNKLCRLHMMSTNLEVRNMYTKVSSLLPWDVVILQSYNMYPEQQQTENDLSKYSFNALERAQQLHTNGSVVGEMPSHCFSIFMNYLLKNEPPKTNFLEGLFSSCWPLEAENQKLSNEYRTLCLSSQSVLFHWATWSAAQLCVNNKLRTPLGKANETFTSFENALKQLARDVMKVQHDCKSPEHVSIVRVRLLLQFIEHLEMAIYNASEGTAIAMPAQASKTVRTFFNTNAPTCREWLSRIRIILVQLSLHAGQNVIAVRHAQMHIANLHKGAKLDTLDYQRCVVYMTMGLLNLQEAEALHGLYVWCSRRAGQQFEWIKCAADQASKKYEQAANGYQKIIEAMDAAGPLDIHVKHFINDQVIMCFKQLNSWLDVIQYKNGAMSLLADNENGMRYTFNTVNFECAQALFNVDSNMFEELTSWKELDDYNTSWSCYDSLRTSECDLYNIALQLPNASSKIQVGVIDSRMKKIHSLMQENVLHEPTQFQSEILLLNYVCGGIRNAVDTQAASASFLVSENFEHDVAKVDCAILSQILWWSEYFGKFQNQQMSTFNNNLRLNIIKKSRKEGNTSLATSQLYRFLKSNSLLFVEDNGTVQNLLVNIGESFKRKLPEINTWTLDSGKAVQNIVKLLYETPTQRRLAFDLSAMASTSLSKTADLHNSVELKQVSAKILLKLAAWLQINEQISITEITSPLGKLLMVLPEIGIENIGSKIIPINEMVIGKLLQFSVSQCPSLAKSWYAFGTWCYRWGRKIVDNSADLSSTLNEDDKEAIQKLLPEECNTEDFDRVVSILSQTRTHADTEDIDSNEIHTSDMIKHQLQNVAGLLHISEDRIDEIVEMWRSLQKRVYAYYGHSVEAYFKYLQFAPNSENVTEATESNSVTVTLRLLRLIVKHALELQKFLEVGLASSPTQPWKIIIPQLFSRLNHPESYVRERVSELLCRVAEDAPHLITFPAVVGALEGGVNFDFTEISLPKDCLSQNAESNEDAELNDIDDNYDSDNEDSKNVLQACFKSMVDTLSKQAPETINQVQTLVKELRRIILLWDELWLGTLAQHHSEINKRQQQLEAEIEKVNNNSNLSYEEKISLISEKHRIIIKPIIFILEQLHDITSVEPETPHEKHFQQKYLGNISRSLARLKSPDEPQNSWKVLKELQNQFQHKANKRSVLQMANISPTLAQIRDTVISMPGQEFRSKVYISHVSTQVSILPTKTKPKKLIFHGSDGQTYTYLFKGLEDMHLDERIMQFLSIANTMMAQNTEGTGHNLYRARHYSVIPLGPRSGLISWVGGTTPVFSLYKRWQQREAAKGTKTGSTTVLRPSELFYNKLNPLLLEHGLKKIDNRKEWPLVVLKQVLSELMAETPSNLLAKELWCHSVSPGAWWQMVRKYSYSVAVMSIIGYIIGLGDRHLDNVLVDLNTGEVVHIDYNVCFEKGKTLRVPEKVPFRLTPNIQDALGVTGVEGMFRLACENILKTMKKGRETLLTLLEAFVYDPLVDWTVANEGLIGTTFAGMAPISSHRQIRKDLEKEVTLSMYRVRCTEMKTEWENNRSAIDALIPDLYASLEEWAALLENSTKADDMLQDLHQQMALVKEAEANGLCKHSLHTLPLRFEAFKKKQESNVQAERSLQQLDLECGKHIEHYHEAVKIMQSPLVQQWYLELGNNKEDGASMNTFDIVREFLLTVGQTNIITQCEQLEKNVSSTIELQLLTARKCLNLLQEYWVVIGQLPVMFIETHRLFFYQKLCKMLLNASDNNAGDHVFQQFFIFNNSNMKPIKHIMAYSYNLNHLYSSMTAKAAKAFDDMNSNRADEQVAVFEQQYLDAKLCLLNFIQREKSASKALEFVVVGELLVLNRTFLALETAASKTGDWLIKLTSREGDWFLDELTLSCSKAIELIDYLRIEDGIDEDREFTQVVNGLAAAKNLYVSLHELNFNFHTIILPESVKKIQCEEPSVLQMIRELEGIIVNVGSLHEMNLHLEKHLTCVVMEMDYAASEILQNKLTTLKYQYAELLHSPGTKGLSAGKMLLMGFNGLFEKLHAEASKLVTHLGALNVPHSWRKLDQVREAKSLATPIFNQQVHEILDDIFLLKRLQTMSDFFGLCIDTCQSFQGIGDAVVVLDDEQMLRPIRKFIADFMSRQFLGISTEAIAYVQCHLLQRLGLDVSNEIEQKDIGAENKVPLDELYHKGWNIFLKSGVFTQNLLAQASSIEGNLKGLWEKIQEPKKLERIVTLCQSSLARVQNQLTAHAWQHEDAMALHVEKSTLLRSKFLLEFRNTIATLTLLQNKIREAHEQQKVLNGSISQRLKWAAGANPGLSETLSSFAAAIASKEKRLTNEQQICARVLEVCANVVHFEMLRYGTSESKAYDQLFLKTYDEWQSANQCKHMKVDAVTAVEENIMKFYTPQMAQNQKWILLVSEKISEIIPNMQTEVAELKSKLHAVCANFGTKVEKLKMQYNRHCGIMNDFKNLIKSMMKIDECAEKAHDFSVEYRSFVENFTSIFQHMKKENTLDDIESVRGKLECLEKDTKTLYNNLMELEGERGGKRQLNRQEGMEVRLFAQKQESMTKGQHRNAYAVGVWRRVRMKLEGKDPDTGRKYSTQEQVDSVIEEAMSLDNLALMYEGWTPWV